MANARPWVTHHELVAAGPTYRQVDYWTRMGLLDADFPTPGSGHQRRYPASEVQVAATMRVLTEAGIEPAAAAKAARNGGWLAPGVQVTITSTNV